MVAGMLLGGVLAFWIVAHVVRAGPSPAHLPLISALIALVAPVIGQRLYVRAGRNVPDDAGEPELGPGLRVRHPVFGPGSVLAVMGSGAGRKLRIQFDRAGVKTVVLRFAQLELD